MQKVLSEVANACEQDLVRRAQQGDHDAFTELLRQNQNACRKLAVSILRDASAAEDEVQSAYTKAYQHLGNFHQESKFSTWLSRIVANQCLMRLRNLRRSRLFYMDDTPTEEGGVYELPARTPNPEQQLGHREVAKILEEEVRRIPPLLRNVFLLREIEELPIQDVANRLGISVPAAKSRLLRARAELRQRIERHQGRMGLHTLTA